jgi:hypothetical protein
MQHARQLSVSPKLTVPDKIAMDESDSAAGEAHRADIVFNTSAANNV